MKKLFLTLFLAGLCAAAWSAGGQEVADPADRILTNGRIYTVDHGNPWAEAVAIRDSRIVYVGDAAGAEAYSGEETEVVDLEGRLVLPAFVDAHMHPAMSAVSYLFEIALFDAYSVEQYLHIVAEFAASHPDIEALGGGGYNRALFDVVGPRKELLDRVEAERPVVLTSMDGHSCWVNSKALELAGITKETPDPEGGVIKRDPETGEPAGLLQESAMGLVSHLVPAPTKEQYKEGLLWLQEWFNSVGLTTCHDAMVSFDPDYYMAYEELAREGLFTIRYRGSWSLSPEMIGGAYGKMAAEPEMSVEEAIEHGIELSKGFKTPHWQVRSFKFFSDQVIEEETGYLKEAYAHRDDDWYGIKVWNTDFLKDTFQKIDAEGFNIHIHQIGDAAADYALTALEHAREINGPRDSRHTFAHLQIIDPEEMDRMAELGMNAVIPPYWTLIDDYFWDLYLPYLGEERAYNEQYPAASLFKRGINTAIHSDFFVTEPDYGWAFYSAITRTLPQRIFELWYGEDAADMVRTTDYDAELGYYEMGPLPPAEERLSLEQAVRAATINGAYADFLEEDLGSIEEGKLADLIVLDRNIFEIDVEEIADMQVVMTLFEGQTVFNALAQ